MEPENGGGAADSEGVEKSPLKVLYMHGGGANPATSYKAQYLIKRFDCECPHMKNTSFYDRCRILQCSTLRSSPSLLPSTPCLTPRPYLTVQVTSSRTFAWAVHWAVPCCSNCCNCACGAARPYWYLQ
jgi:hypothetical protein